MSVINDILDFSLIDAGKLGLNKTEFALGETLEEQQADEAGDDDRNEQKNQEAALPGAGTLFEFFVHGAPPGLLVLWRCGQAWAQGFVATGQHFVEIRRTAGFRP